MTLSMTSQGSRGDCMMKEVAARAEESGGEKLEWLAG